MNTQSHGYKYKNILSGKYEFDDVKNDANMYTNGSCGFYLIYRNGFWFFTNEKYAVENNNDNRFKGLLRAKTSGM